MMNLDRDYLRTLPDFIAFLTPLPARMTGLPRTVYAVHGLADTNLKPHLIVAEQRPMEPFLRGVVYHSLIDDETWGADPDSHLRDALEIFLCSHRELLLKHWRDESPLSGRRLIADIEKRRS